MLNFFQPTFQFIALRKSIFLSSFQSLLLIVISGAALPSYSALPAPSAVTTLTFTSGGSWSDGVAEDGEGGSIDIPGLVIQIRNISNVDGTNLGVLSYQNNGYLFSNDASYSGLTHTSDAGWKGMSIKSSDGSNFQLNSFKYYNWGDTQSLTNTVVGYRDGAQVASMTFQGYSAASLPMTVSLDNTFDNVDDVRLYISAGGYLGNQLVTFHSINNIAIDAPSSLPVTLVNFSVKTSENNIKLAWRTTSETNASHFEIERGADGKSFDNVGSIMAKGESQAIETYTFIDTPDKTSTPLTQYYRLKMVDNDGTFAYSRIETARWNLMEAVRNVIISPNPSKNSSPELSLRFEGLAKGNYTVQIINFLGQKRAEKTFAWDGVSDSKFNTSNLPAGLYLVKTVFSGEEIVRRLLIQ